MDACQSRLSGHSHQISQSIFCVTRSMTHNDNVESRETEVIQSSWAESMLPLAERYGEHRVMLKYSFCKELKSKDNEMMLFICKDC